jgi:hypothetical protein
MNKQTYRELLDELKNLTKEQLDCDVTIQVEDEYYPGSLWIIDNDDILDTDHPVISNH